MKQEKIDFTALENIAMAILAKTADKLIERKPETVRYSLKTSKGDVGTTCADITTAKIVVERVLEDKSVLSEDVTSLSLVESGLELDPADEFHTLTLVRSAQGGVCDNWGYTLENIKKELFDYSNLKIIIEETPGQPVMILPY